MLEPQYARKLLELGFGAVVSPDYQLSPTISVYDGAVTDSFDAYNWAQNDLPGLLFKDAKVELDANRTVTWGHSSGGTLALLMVDGIITRVFAFTNMFVLNQAKAPKPPCAILDLYGVKYLRNPRYHYPALMPPVELPSKEHQDKIFEQVPPPVGAPPPIGPTGFDLSKHRNAWFVSQLLKGTAWSSIVQDGDYDRVDPTTIFSASFPPTMFIHGIEDEIVPLGFSEKAYEELKSEGVETDLIKVEDVGHGFEAGKKAGSTEYNTVVKGFKFLRAHV